MRTENEILNSFNKKYNNVVLSICCISYNHASFITDAIEGFLIQQLEYPFEILIHDDASTDETQKIIKEYEDKYPKLIKPIYQKINQHSKGINPNWAFNFSRAKGKYIALCEGDDYWVDPMKMQKQICFLENNKEYSVCYHDSYMINESIPSNKIKKGYQKDLSKNDLCKGKIIPLNTLCFRNIVTSEYPKEIKYMKGTHRFVLSLCGQYGKGKWLGNCIIPGVYRIHEGGIWSELSNNEKLFISTNTCYWIYSYYKRIKDVEMKDYWFKEFCKKEKKLHKNLFNNKNKKINFFEKKVKKILSLKKKIIKIDYLNSFNIAVGIKYCAHWSAFNNSKDNFGDALNPLIFKYLTGKKIVHIKKIYNKINKPVFVLIGSTLDKLKERNIVIAGAGFKTFQDKVTFKPKKILAVRGPLSRDVFLNSNIPCPEIYCDPGLFISDVYPKKTEKKEYDIGIIPHYIDQDIIASLNILESSYSYKVIDINSGIENICNQILKCRYIASSSLHGIIAAHAYDIPATWLILSDRISGGKFKFQDYYHSIGENKSLPYNVINNLDLEKVIKMAMTYNIKDNKMAFRKVFERYLNNLK